MNNVKKIMPYFLVGIFSTITTIAAMYYFSSKNEVGNYFSSTNSTIGNSNYRLIGMGTSTDFTNAADKTVNAVVSIKNFSTNNSRTSDDMFDFFFGFKDQNQEQRENQPSGLGSGVIISPNGYIITNNHVVENATKLEVTLNNQQSYTATLVGKDPSTDIALIKIDQNNLPFLNFYDSDQVKVGEWVLAVGNPFGLNSTVTAGIISAKGRSINILSQKSRNPIESFIQTDAAINPGNSGGALVNTNGDLIGINTAISSHTGTYEGYGFAVPSNLAKKVVEDLKQFGLVQRGYIGIVPLDMTDEMSVKNYNLQKKASLKAQEGVLVVSLTTEGGAYDAGIEEGDIIKQIDNYKVKNYADLSQAIGSKRPGDKINVIVNREGKEKSFTIELRDEKGKTKLRTKEDLSVSEIIGAQFDPLTDTQKTNYGLDSGVWVKDIDEGGKLNSIGIMQDYIILEVNGKAVNSQADIDKILKNYKGNVSLKFVDRFGRIYQKGFQM